MKTKDSTSKTFKDRLSEAIDNELSPIRPKITRTKEKVNKGLSKNPRKTFIWMWVILILNFGAWLFFSSKPKNEVTTFNNAYKETKTSVESTPGFGGIPYTWKNYKEMKKLKDTIEYLHSKEKLTKEDTAIFVRLFDKLQSLEQQK